MELDLKDKNEALDIDMTQLDLSENSANISHKPDATRVPKGTVQPETWYTYSENNKMLAEQVESHSQSLVLSMKIILGHGRVSEVERSNLPHYRADQQ